MVDTFPCYPVVKVCSAVPHSGFPGLPFPYTGPLAGTALCEPLGGFLLGGTPVTPFPNAKHRVSKQSQDCVFLGCVWLLVVPCTGLLGKKDPFGHCGFGVLDLHHSTDGASEELSERWSVKKKIQVTGGAMAAADGAVEGLLCPACIYLV